MTLELVDFPNLEPPKLLKTTKPAASTAYALSYFLIRGEAATQFMVEF